ncbi:hypothetical protein [Magnetospirillum gryphiswaldense]|uniref:hypothetical protein n=1 Tax=Magnetospirillum gryphiswaldense TaxID=55518 RepID=UPI0018F8AF25|nr:hypothetical protein [Magnetospirillum gryphiswaldense]
MRLLRDALPPHVSHPRKFDLLIIDEAHNVAPTVGRYAVESLRTRLVRLAAPHFQHKLFLTATPHDGYTESFTALLELLDDQRFARNVLPSDPQLARVMVRRLKSDLVDANGKRIYPERRLEALPVEYSEDERDARRQLEAYIKSRESGADGGRAVDHFVHQLLRKRLSSSPATGLTAAWMAASSWGVRSTMVGRSRAKRVQKPWQPLEQNHTDGRRRFETTGSRQPKPRVGRRQTAQSAPRGCHARRRAAAVSVMTGLHHAALRLEPSRAWVTRARMA